MLRHRRPTTAWDAAYDAERNATIIWRIRSAVGLCLVCLAVAWADVMLAHPEAGSLRLKFLGAFWALSCAIGLATLLRDARRNPLPIAVTFGAGIVLTLDVYSLYVPNGIAIAGASLCATVMGLAILLPWGPRPQAIVSATAVSAYGGLWLLGGGDTSALLSIVVSSSIVGVVGASLLDRYRRTASTQAWQQQRLAALGRDLAAQETLADAATRLLEHAAQLLPSRVCLVAPLATAADGTRVFRVSHVQTQPAWGVDEFVGLELGCESPLVTDILRRGVLLMPDDAPDSELGAVVAAQPGVRALYVAITHGTEPLGILSWVRRGPFTTAERELAGRVADPAALAFKTTRLLADLRESSRLKSQFVSTVSHELRTPLNVILGFAEMARDIDFEPEERGRCLDRIHDAGRELLTLIESTLEVGRLEAARSPVRIERIRLPVFWRELAQACATIPREAGVRLEWDEAIADVAIATDPHKLRVIVRNLVGNALKFTAAGHVRATLALDGDRLALTVADTGIGIRAEDHAVIFEMFRQADGSDNRRFGGTGLGLYIVRCFAEQLGGTIAVDSAPGLGSTFHVALPIASATDEPARRAA